MNKLPQELINKIAAGEVIERPASVVKELVDNSIDAESTKIQITVVNGGIDLIEVSDNGIGIPQSNLQNIFDSHTTSKISSFDDLNNLLTMGFRGEALSTIAAVSNVKLVSKYLDDVVANEIYFEKDGEKLIKTVAREEGTLVIVKDIFGAVPARKKFLKSPQTEYKKILEVLMPYFIIYPNIHFTVIKDGKTVIDLINIQNSEAKSIDKGRVKAVLKNSFVDRMLTVFFNGNGIKISGFVGHPSDHGKSVPQYIFVNRRPVKDNGIAKAVFQGMERYIPHGERVPYILNVEIKPDLVDVNVHPRKEEVRFLNPFRVYVSVEEAIKKSVSSATSYKVENRDFFPAYSSQTLNRTNSSKEILPQSGKSSSVHDSLLFSKEVLSDFSYTRPEISEVEKYNIRSIFQIFNKYIVIEFIEDTLWIIDQHAAAERITFEKLKKEKSLSQQKMLVPSKIEMSEIELIGMEGLKEFFHDFGFEYMIDDGELSLLSVPVEFVHTDFKKFFSEVLSLSDNVKYIKDEIDRLKENILATMSCHGSVRSGQALHKEEMIDIYNELIKCDNPYSCPHGRPAVWKLGLSDIDMNFERTY